MRSVVVPPEMRSTFCFVSQKKRPKYCNITENGRQSGQYVSRLVATYAKTIKSEDTGSIGDWEDYAFARRLPKFFAKETWQSRVVKIQDSTNASFVITVT